MISLSLLEGLIIREERERVKKKSSEKYPNQNLF